MSTSGGYESSGSGGGGGPAAGSPGGGGGGYGGPGGAGYGGGGYGGGWGRGMGMGMGRAPRPNYPVETKPFLGTSEFVLPFLAWIGLLITTCVNDDIDARRFWIFTTALLVGYMISRGLAKSGTKSRAWDPREDYDPARGGHGGSR